MLPRSLARSKGALGFALTLCSCGAKPSAEPAPAGPATAVPQAAGETAPPVVTPPPPEPTAIENDASRAAHLHVQTRAAGSALPARDDVPYQPIERAKAALQHFHTALRELEGGRDADGKVRVLVYGSSSVAVDRYTGYLRGYLQQRFGDGGIGFVAAAPLWRWHRHNEVALTSTKGWSTEHAQKKTTHLGGHLGLLGAATYAKRKRSSTIIRGGTPESFTDYADSDRVTLHYLEQPKGGRFTVELGDRKLRTVPTRGNAVVAKQLEVPKRDGPLPPLHVVLQGDGEVALLGASFERDEPGVVVDALGIGGTRAANMLAWDEPEWATAVAARTADLWVLAYGANECIDEDEDIEVYRNNLQRVLLRLHTAAPDASCVLVGPVDFPVQDPETQLWGPRARLSQIIEIQRELAGTQGCGFFDTRAWMGGEGSMDRWVVAELAKADHLHFTKLGYLHLGRVLADALMYDLDAG
ncbi:MAG: hypothetical protein KBB21_07255 [Nannocystaceae bacterium]|nr:hypothetical protein [Nannocystaceae bacterium]